MQASSAVQCWQSTKATSFIVPIGKEVVYQEKGSREKLGECYVGVPVKTPSIKPQYFKLYHSGTALTPL